jgi:hypothetical protein
VQPGYYEQGRWHAEPSAGYYDAQGRWIRAETNADANVGEHRGAGLPATSPAFGLARQHDPPRPRRRTLSRREGGEALRRSRHDQPRRRAMPHRGGGLRPRDQRTVMASSTSLTADVREMRRGPVFED